jgi:hypothetical protein
MEVFDEAEHRFTPLSLFAEDHPVRADAIDSVQVTPRAVLEKLAGIQMRDVSFPTTDGRRLVMPRYTEPSPEQAVLLHHLNLVLA